MLFCNLEGLLVGERKNGSTSVKFFCELVLGLLKHDLVYFFLWGSVWDFADMESEGFKNQNGKFL